MVERRRFDLENEVSTPSEPDNPDLLKSTEAPTPKQPPLPNDAGNPGSFGADDGFQIAAGLTSAGYHPVVLFGNANSGKTSLLLSLISLIRTEPDLHCGLDLGEPVLNTDTPYGRYLRDQAEGFYGKKTQDFIEGKAAPKTAIEAPFFIPVVFRPEGKPEVRLAFMESNGEWYRPDRESDKLFPALRRQIEEFLSAFQEPVSFIHLLPYTQQATYTSGTDQYTDDSEINEASLAIVGALKAYLDVRANKMEDRHLMLVTKWDAHDKGEMDRVSVLQDSSDLERFLCNRYNQAFAFYRGMGLQSHQQQLATYCAGQMRGQSVIMPRRGEELHDALIEFPTRLWQWLYKTTLEQLGEQSLEPFPSQPRPHWFVRLLNRFF